MSSQEGDSGGGATNSANSMNMLTAAPTQNINVFIVNKPRDAIYGVGGGKSSCAMPLLKWHRRSVFIDEINYYFSS